MDGEEFEKIDENDVDKNAHQCCQEENTDHDITHRKIASSDELSEEFLCSVCLLIAVQPTSLICGHTFCRVCLAKWYFISNKKVCPTCSQAFHGHPKINIHIQNMTTKFCSVELKKRERALEINTEDKDILKRFDEELKKRHNDTVGGRVFGMGMTFAIVAIVIYLIWYSQFSDIHLSITKPVKFWKPQDVTAWLDNISLAIDYGNKDIGSIDGNTLLSVDEKSLLQLFNVSEPVHQNAFLEALAKLKEHGIKPPSTLWEYKDVFPGRCLFLFYGLKQFPRVTILYTWFNYYDDIFLPFVKTSTDSGAGVDIISTSQWVNFLFYALLLPQWLVIAKSFQMLSDQFFTMLLIITRATFIQILEILWIMSLFRNNNWEQRNIIQIFKYYGKHLFLALTTEIIWPIIPKVVCDGIFFIFLYLTPFYMFTTIVGKLRELWIVQ